MIAMQGFHAEVCYHVMYKLINWQVILSRQIIWETLYIIRFSRV